MKDQKGKTNNGKSYRGRAKFRKDKFDREKVETKTKDNDATWYVANGELTKDVASFSFNNALGDRIIIDGTNASGMGTKFSTRAPGIMSIFTVPAIGRTDAGKASPVNIAARNIYSYVRHANSGHSNYDPADLMLYLLAMDSIYTYWSYLCRIYGVCHVYNKVNRYYGDALISAMGVDPGSIRGNLADFRAYINMFAVKASAFAVPKTMPYFVRHSWMYSNIYKDQDIPKSQLYLYVPAALHRFDIDSTTGVGKLTVQEVAVTGNSTEGWATIRSLSNAQLQLIGNDMLNSLMTLEDMGIISGDILKAYGSENLWQLSPVPEDYSVIPVYSDEVLAQIHNTDFAGVAPCSSSESGAENAIDIHAFDIVQTVGVGEGDLQMNIAFKGGTHLSHDRILDLWVVDPTPELTLVATRNKIATAPWTKYQTNGLVIPTAIGSEIALFAAVGTMADSGGTMFVPVYTGEAWPSTMSDMFPVTRFNEYPGTYKVAASGANHGRIDNYFGDLDTYTTITGYELENIHTSALLSLFGVPYIK